MKKEDMSCIDCAVKNCNKIDKTYPDFCLTTHMDEEVLNEAMECYNEDENRKVTIAAAEVEYENYCKHTRVEEIMDFAKKINAKKVYLGISSSYICHGIYIYFWDDKCLCRKCLELVVYTFAAGDDCSILLSFCGAGEKDKILSFNDYSHRQKKIVAGENYLYWVHDFVF